MWCLWLVSLPAFQDVASWGEGGRGGINSHFLLQCGIDGYTIRSPSIAQKGEEVTPLEGEYRHKLDAKGRLSLPAEFRKVLTPELKVILSPLDDCLLVFEPEAYSEWVENLFESKGGYSPSNRQMAAQRKILNSRVKRCEIDNSGRINISAAQREAAGLDKDVVIVGDTDHFEIWDVDRWDAFCSEFDLASLMS